MSDAFDAVSVGRKRKVTRGIPKKNTGNFITVDDGKGGKRVVKTSGGAPEKKKGKTVKRNKVKVDPVMAKYRAAIKAHVQPSERAHHTSGAVIVDKDTVLKPVTGLREYINWDGKQISHEFKTHEYEAIKALEDLPCIPHNTELITIDGYEYIKRPNYHIVEDFKIIPEKNLIELEQTMREANKRGWEYGDEPQIAFDKKRYKYVWFDWSTAIERGANTVGAYSARDYHAINVMWSKSNLAATGKMREQLTRYKNNYNFGEEIFNILPKRFEDPDMPYAYLSIYRPPSLMWMELPKGSVAVPTKQEGDWRSNGFILTPEPLSPEQIKTYQLTPEEYRFTEDTLK